MKTTLGNSSLSWSTKHSSIPQLDRIFLISRWGIILSLSQFFVSFTAIIIFSTTLYLLLVDVLKKNGGQSSTFNVNPLLLGSFSWLTTLSKGTSLINSWILHIIWLLFFIVLLLTIIVYWIKLENQEKFDFIHISHIVIILK